MNYLIVYTHPNPVSFNHAIVQIISEELGEREQYLRVRDLYALGFDPVIKISDYEAIKHEEVPQDIRTEQGHILWADIIIFVSPVFWAGLPALLKGYIERVFTQGFAYDFVESRFRGLLKDKKAVIINTTGGSLQMYESSGMLESIRQTIDGGIFRFCEMEVLGHKFFMNVPFITDSQRAMMLEEVRDMVKTLCRTNGKRIE